MKTIPVHITFISSISMPYFIRALLIFHTHATACSLASRLRMSHLSRKSATIFTYTTCGSPTPNVLPMGTVYLGAHGYYPVFVTELVRWSNHPFFALRIESLNLTTPVHSYAFINASVVSYSNILSNMGCVGAADMIPAYYLPYISSYLAKGVSFRSVFIRTVTNISSSVFMFFWTDRVQIVGQWYSKVLLT